MTTPLPRRLRRNHGGYLEWVRLTDTPLLVLAVLFLLVLLVPAVTNLTHAERVAFGVANVAIWAAFGLDYFVRLYLALERKT